MEIATSGRDIFVRNGMGRCGFVTGLLRVKLQFRTGSDVFPALVGSGREMSFLFFTLYIEKYILWIGIIAFGWPGVQSGWLMFV